MTGNQYLTVHRILAESIGDIEVVNSIVLNSRFNVKDLISILEIIYLRSLVDILC